ncbi:MAG: WYL domain-containing protein [Breznakibacter sp.]|nr:WYL domain-containing protein [Breznakibacter sp.]
MANKQIQRYLSIISCLRLKRSTYKEIATYWRDQCDLLSIKYNFSKRTFERDMIDIAEVYSVSISYDNASKNYSIDSEEEHYFDKVKQRLLENALTNFALQIYTKADRWIELEQRKVTGVEFLHLILKGLDKSKQLKFTHNNFWKPASIKIVEPLGIKEFKQRWYLVGADTKDGAIKIYGLDRVSNLEVLTTNYKYPKTFDIHQYFKHNFGVEFGAPDNLPQEVILSFTPFQAHYIKTLPLHPTQKIVKDDENEYRISLNVRLTFDFQMEILSMGEHVTVIAPQELRDSITEKLQKSLNNYIF